MIIFSKSHIRYWSKWRTKNKFLFCIASGAVYTLFVFIGNIIIRPILGHHEHLIGTSFFISICSFIPGAFLSIALWYENERRFKLWQKENEATDQTTKTE